MNHFADLTDILCIFVLVMYATVTLILAFKYQTGYLIDPEHRKEIPERFLNVICLAMFTVIVVAPIVSKLCSPYVEELDADSMFTGVFFGMMIMNFIYAKGKSNKTP